MRMLPAASTVLNALGKGENGGVHVDAALRQSCGDWGAGVGWLQSVPFGGHFEFRSHGCVIPASLLGLQLCSELLLSDWRLCIIA